MTVRRPVPRLLRTAAIGALVTGLAGFSVFHNRLLKSAPADKSTVAAAPKEIRLWFAETPEPALSRITLMTGDSTPVATSKVRKTDDPLSIAIDVTGPMPAGPYLVRWRTSGEDGHVIQGTFGFTVGK